MNGDKSDASTSTDDVKDRPLCLFYFTHPFGVLSPEPPTISAAPPSVTRAFLNMEPISPFYWPGSAGQASPSAEESCRCSSLSPSSLTLERAPPVGVVRVARRDCSTLSSSLFASDAWFPSSGGSRMDFPRRPPYSRILPPLQLPSPRDLADYSSDDIWPRKCLNKFSLPPIELPPVKLLVVRSKRREELSSVESVSSAKEVKCRRKLGVHKARRRGGRGGRGGRDVRRLLGCLMRRAVRGRGAGERGGGGGGASLARVLSTIREAWAEPSSLRHRCRVLSRMYARNSAIERDHILEGDSERESDTSAMMTRTQLVELQPRADASPGLMRRRYSVPETIMRKYRLAQQSSDTEECTAGEGDGSPAAGPSPRDSPRSAGDSPRHLRRDRELMRKSALLRRMWARPAPASLSPPACHCETRSLEGSRDELQAEPHPDRKRQCRGPLADLSSCVDTTDALSEGSATPPRAAADSTAPASPYTVAPRACDRFYDDSDAFSTSVSTAKETPGSTELASSIERHFEGLVSACEPSVENEDHHAPPSPLERAPPYELLEVVVSESSSPPEGERAPLAPAAPRWPTRDLSLDEYVSRVLMESLNSLSDRLESMNAGAGDRRLSVVEKEIKVRLQNAAVNTIVHLSPTSNHQIIFGNEELCDDREPERQRQLCDRGADRDECNNPRAPAPPEDNNNASPTSRAAAFDAVLQHDNVNRAVLQQIQKLFRDELRREDDESGAPGDVGAVSHIEISSVDAFLSGGAGAGAETISVLTSDAGSPVASVGAGNYFRDLERAPLVPRRSAVPHTASMEVNTSSSEDAEADAFASDVASLVDSLDDPDSPRSALLRRHARAERSDPARPREGSAAFFVRIRDDTTPERERARVAECMPERIRQKLHRRHRKRELRMECARRGKVRQLRDELERRRSDQLARDQRRLERDAAALADQLLDDVIFKVARDEYRSIRLQRPPPVAPGLASSPEAPARLPTRPEPGTRREHPGSEARDGPRRRSDADEEFGRRPERHQVRGRLVARPAVATERGPRRIYQKSEIREGDKCIEILEILEYSAASRSSPESTPTDESGERARGRRSRIPVPVPAPAPAGDHMRLTGGDGRAAPPLAELLLRALAPPARPPAPLELRSRSNSLRFKRVFDMIPEERAGPGGDSPSPAEEGEGGRRASAPSLASPGGVPAPQPSLPPPAAPAEPARRVDTRSAGTSPPAEARRRSQTTMTSPSSRSAATSPWRAPPPRPPPPQEGIVCALRPTLHRTASLVVE